MASRAYQPDALALFLAAIPSLPRPVLARLTARMIDRLDDMDGEPDLEPNGDEEDGTDAEDESLTSYGRGTWHGPAWATGPGCKVADGGGI